MGRQDSNLRMTESKSVGLPLADAPIYSKVDEKQAQIKSRFSEKSLNFLLLSRIFTKTSYLSNKGVWQTR